MKPTVAFITPGSFCIPSSRSSSVEQVVAHVTPFLQSFANCHIYGRLGKGYPAREKVNGLSYYRFSFGTSKAYIRRVCKHLQKRSYDLIQVDNRPRFVCEIKQRMPHTRVWLFLHSLNFVSTKSISPRSLANCLALTDMIMVNSLYLKEEMVKRFPEMESKIVVNHLGVNVNQFCSKWEKPGVQTRSEARKRKRFAGKKVILYVGRLIPQKGVHVLIQAMRSVRQQHPDAVLVIVGGAFYGSKRATPYVRKLWRLAKKYGKLIQFIPYVPHNQIHEWFRLADIAVVPSVEREAFGLVNVEAMAAGVPVVGTSSGGMKEIIISGVTGLTVEPQGSSFVDDLASSIHTLLSDIALRQQFGMNSVQRVKDYFTWEHTANRWMKLFEEP